MSQLYTVSGMPIARRRQVDELNARLGLLPNILSQQSQQKYQAAQIENMTAQQKLDEARFGIEQGKYNLAEQDLGLKKQELGLAQSAADFQNTRFGWEQQRAKKTQEYQEGAQMREMGVKAAGLGFTGLTNNWANFKLGDISDKIGTLWGGLTSTKTPASVADPEHINPGNSGQTVLNQLPIGASAMGGLAGFAVPSVLGVKKGPMKSVLGAGIGGLAGYFSSGGDWGGAIGGGLLGGLGGLF